MVGYLNVLWSGIATIVFGIISGPRIGPTILIIGFIMTFILLVAAILGSRNKHRSQPYQSEPTTTTTTAARVYDSWEPKRGGPFEK